MEPNIFVAENHSEADAYDIEQNQSKTPEERIDDYIVLRKRIYGEDNPDVREYERSTPS
jgi:hypothetical protein